jgi:hypothetical protein
VATYIAAYGKEVEVLDIYLYMLTKDPLNEGIQACLRTGHSPGQYRSPGSLIQAARFSQSDPYRKLFRVLLHFGRPTWEKRPPDLS